MPSRSRHRRKGYKIQAREEMIAIVFLFEEGRHYCVRLHTQDIPRVLKTFEKYVQNAYPTARYINYYKQKRYYYREYLIEQNKVYCREAIAQSQKIGEYRDLRDPVLRCMQYNSLY